MNSQKESLMQTAVPIGNGTPQSPGRPRAHSAPEVAMYSTAYSNSDQEPQSPHQVRGTSVQPTRSMKNGMSTTVPQNIVTQDLNCKSHQPRKSKNVQRRVSRSSRTRDSFEMKCCRINVLLVVMQLCLGVVITALAFYMETLTPSLQIRECPYWAGIPLLVAGVVGIYFCATGFAAYPGNIRVFIVKAICFTLSFSCIFLSMVAAVFAGIHGNRIASFLHCGRSEEGRFCKCVQTDDSHARVFIYSQLSSCDMVFNSVKDYLILQCALSSIASGVCIWFNTLLWKARYHEFYPGIRNFPIYGDPSPHQNYISNSRRPSPFWMIANQSQIIGNTRKVNNRNVYEMHHEAP